MQKTEFDYENDHGSIILNASRETVFFLSKGPLEPSKPYVIFKPSVTLRRYELIEELERHLYTFENREDIYAYLLRVSDAVIDVLYEAPLHIADFFEEATLYLKVIRDPEEDFELLFIEIKTDLPADSAVEKLDAFDDAWWLEVDDSVSSVLEIDV